MSWIRALFSRNNPPVETVFRLGFSCKNGHNQSVQTTWAVENELYGKKQICEECGEPSIPSVLKITWMELWNRWVGKTEFVRFLGKETVVKLSDNVVAKLQVISRSVPDRKVLPEDRPVYEAGLEDGAADLAQYVLDQLEEEK